MDEHSLLPHRTRRISLTKSQLRTELGVELLSLCESVTADGVLAPEEIRDLQEWVEDSAVDDLPAATYLREVVGKVLADGKITGDECLEVYKAVEAVLPPEVRRQAMAARREVDAAQRETVQSARKKEREETKIAREKERDERRRNAVIGSANFMVAGIRHEGRADVITRYANIEDAVRLKRDPDNRYSRHAIAVMLANGKQIGFVPETHAQELAPQLDDGAKYVAWITKILGSARVPIPVVQANLYNADATVNFEESLRESSFATGDADADESRRRLPEAADKLGSAKRGWIWIGLIALVLIFFIAV